MNRLGLKYSTPSTPADPARTDCCNVLLSELFKQLHPPPASGRRLTDAQVLTIALVAARFFGDNLVIGKHCLEQHWGQNH